MTKRWFITGCSTGFGRALAELLLERGDQVAVTGLTLESVQDIVAKAPDRALGLELDVRNPEQVRSSLDAAWKHFGGIDVLVNNAGYGVQGPLESVTDEQIQNLFATNVFGMMDVIRAALPRLREQGSGHIINISSIGGRCSGALMALYSATKYAVEGLCAGLAPELAPFGIKVTAIEPGSFATNFGTTSLVKVEDNPAYREAMQAFEKAVASANPQDPRGAARVIADVADTENPPLQLPLGRPAYDMAMMTLKAQQEELEQWRAYSERASAPVE